MYLEVVQLAVPELLECCELCFNGAALLVLCDDLGDLRLGFLTAEKFDEVFHPEQMV